jgi:signal transduction histidine kinase
MRGYRLRTRSPGRWIIAALVIVLTLVYSELCLHQRVSPAQLGVELGQRDEMMVVDRVYPAGLAWAAGVRPGAHVVAFTRTDSDTAQIQSLTALTVVTAAGEQRTVTITAATAERSSYRWFLFLFIAAVFVIVGAGVFVISSTGSGPILLLGMSVAAAFGLLSAIATPTGAPWALAGVLVGIIGFATLTFLLFFDLAVLKAQRVARNIVYTVCAGSTALLLAGYALTIFGDGSQYDSFRPWLLVILCSYLLAACGLAVFALSRRYQSRRERDVLKLAVLGVCASVVPFCALVLLPELIGVRLTLPPDVAAMTLVILPLSLGLAVLTRQWWDIEQLARRSVVALTIWSLLLLGYSYALGSLQQLFSPTSGVAGAVIHATTFQVALIAGSFPIVQHVLRWQLERQLFHVNELPSVHLQRLQSALAQRHTVNAIATTALTEIGAVLRPNWIQLTVRVAPRSTLTYHWPHRASETGASSQRSNHEDRESQRRFILRAQGQFIGTIAIGLHQNREWLPETTTFVAGVLPLLGVTLHNALLLERLQHQVEILGQREYELAKLSTQLLEAQEDERRRLAFDLHDDPLQRTILLERALTEATAISETTSWRNATTEIIISLRAICASLRPPMLEDLGFVPALVWLVNDTCARSDLTIDVVIDPILEEEPMSPDVAVVLYRVTQEALNNCLKHAQATQITVELRRSDTHIQLRVIDNGCGYDPTQRHCSLTGLGIAGMRERLRAVGGRFAIGKIGEGGTAVTFTIPHREVGYDVQRASDVAAYYDRG